MLARGRAFLICCLLAGGSSAQNDAVVQACLDAYRQTTTYQAVTDVLLTRRLNGAVTPVGRIQARVAYDLLARRLAVGIDLLPVDLAGNAAEAPFAGFDLLRDGNELVLRQRRLVAEDVNGELRRRLDLCHARQEVTDGQVFAVLAQLLGLNQLGLPTLPDCVMLTSGDPLWDLFGAEASRVAGEEKDLADPLRRPRLGLTGEQLQVSFHLDPETMLLRSGSVVPTRATDAGTAAAVHYRIELVRHNVPLPANLFQLDLAGSVTVGWADLGAGGASVSPSPAAEQPAGRRVPELKLPSLSGSSASIGGTGSGVQIVAFWSGWSAWSIQTLPVLQEIHEWIEQAGRAIGLAAVNVGEERAEVVRIIGQLGLSLPVLLDRDGSAAERYQVSGVPTVLVVANGRVRAEFAGYRDDLGESLRRACEVAVAGR